MARAILCDRFRDSHIGYECCEGKLHRDPQLTIDAIARKRIPRAHRCAYERCYAQGSAIGKVDGWGNGHGIESERKGRSYGGQPNS